MEERPVRLKVDHFKSEEIFGKCVCKDSLMKYGV